MSKSPSATDTPKRICGAKTRSGKPCKGLPMPNGRCRMHGGTQPVGIASPNFKDGRYSKYIPARMLQRYEQAASDPELLVLRHDIALVDSRLAELLKRADKGQAEKHWEEARKANDEIRKALLNENYGTVIEASQKLDRTIGSGLTDYETWLEISGLLEQRRKLSESEQKRLIAANLMVTAEQAMTLAAALLAAVKENVKDREALAAIQSTFNRLVSMEAA